LVYARNATGRIPKVELRKNRAAIDKWKVYISKAYGAGESYPHQILGVPFVGEPGSVCTQTYLYLGPFETESEARHVVSYLACRLTRFLVLLHKPTQDAMKAVYSLVPRQDFSEPWTDQKLYEKYGITDAEITFIESMIRPMDVDE
jgi:site-specific DNA-methyltransferase (adenine-specific)